MVSCVVWLRLSVRGGEGGWRGPREEERVDAQSVRATPRVPIETGSDVVQTESERLVCASFVRAWWSYWLIRRRRAAASEGEERRSEVGTRRCGDAIELWIGVAEGFGPAWAEWALFSLFLNDDKRRSTLSTTTSHRASKMLTFDRI